MHYFFLLNRVGFMYSFMLFLVTLYSVLSITAMPVRGMWDESSEYVQALWKGTVRKQTGKLSTHETEHVLTAGTLEPKLLETIGKAAERAVVYAQKSVGYDKKPVERDNQPMSDRPMQWEGKLMVLACRERQEFIELFSKLKQGRPHQDEKGAAIHEKGKTLVLLDASSSQALPRTIIRAVELSGAATLTRRHDSLPNWFATAYGRTLAYRFDAKAFTTERGKVPYWAAKVHVRDLMQEENGAVPVEALLPLQASLVECLAQSPNLQEKWFLLLDEVTYRGGNLYSALEEQGIKMEALQINWKDSLWKQPESRSK